MAQCTRLVRTINPPETREAYGQKPPLQPMQVRNIRSRLQVANKKRDLASFNIASVPRGSRFSNGPEKSSCVIPGDHEAETSHAAIL
jgi:hypothetical protein